MVSWTFCGEYSGEIMESVKGLRLVAMSLLITMIIIVGLATAYVIKISVLKSVDVEISSYGYDDEMNLVRFTIETFNRGSVAYDARVRMDILEKGSGDDDEKSEIVFTAWGQEIEMYPGSRKITRLYWHTDEVDDKKVRVRVYFADEIFEEVYEVKKTEKTSNAESGVFEVRNFHVYDDYVLFDIKPNKDVNEVVVIPEEFQSGWVLEQKVIKGLKSGQTIMVSVPYKASLFTEENVVLGFVGDGSTIYDEYEFLMQKKTGFAGHLQRLVDSIRLLFLDVA